MCGRCHRLGRGRGADALHRGRRCTRRGRRHGGCGPVRITRLLFAHQCVQAGTQPRQCGRTGIDAGDQCLQTRRFTAITPRDRLLGGNQHVRLQLGQRRPGADAFRRLRARIQVVLDRIVAGRRQYPARRQRALGACVRCGRGSDDACARHPVRRRCASLHHRGTGCVPACRQAQRRPYPQSDPPCFHGHPCHAGGKARARS